MTTALILPTFFNVAELFIIKRYFFTEQQKMVSNEHVINILLRTIVDS